MSTHRTMHLILPTRMLSAEKEQAFAWLDRAYSQKDAGLYLIKSDPFFKNLKDDSRYKAFLRKMNLPE